MTRRRIWYLASTPQTCAQGAQKFRTKRLKANLGPINEAPLGDRPLHNALQASLPAITRPALTNASGGTELPGHQGPTEPGWTARESWSD